MTPELIGIVTVGVALAGLILGFVGPALRELRRDVGDLRERMARLEGLFEGFAGRQPTTQQAFVERPSTAP